MEYFFVFSMYDFFFFLEFSSIAGLEFYKFFENNVFEYSNDTSYAFKRDICVFNKRQLEDNCKNDQTHLREIARKAHNLCTMACNRRPCLIYGLSSNWKIMKKTPQLPTKRCKRSLFSLVHRYC